VFVVMSLAIAAKELGSPPAADQVAVNSDATIASPVVARSATVPAPKPYQEPVPAVDLVSETDSSTAQVSIEKPSEDIALATAQVFPATKRLQPQTPRVAETAAATKSERVYGPEPDPAGGSGADFDTLIELITTTTSPDTWEDVGGPGTISPYETGVRADPLAKLDRLASADQSGDLARLASQAESITIPDAQQAGPSDLRVVSLQRLERYVAGLREAGKELPEDVRYLAGLTAVRYVFVYPDGGDVVIAGPAESWKIDDEGRPVGIDSGRPLLQLDDLVVLLRVFAPSGHGSFGCSINPREANLKQVKEFVETSNASGPLHPRMRNRWLDELQKRLGMQDVQIYGVAYETRVAKIIFEADYRMKLIGIDKADGGPNIPSFFALLRRNDQTQGVPMSALRWWLTMKYDGILHSPNRDAFEIRGSSVLVQSENQFVTAQGKRIQTGKAEPLNRQFAQNFTDHYAELAAKDKVFAELQNVFDMAMAAAICRRDGLFEMAGWDMGAFAPGGAYQPAEVETPTEIESVMNHRVYGGRDIVVQVAGGVVGNVTKIVNDRAMRAESTELAAPQRNETLVHWWWDAAK